jgi:hypothetical protein
MRKGDAEVIYDSRIVKRDDIKRIDVKYKDYETRESDNKTRSSNK